MAESSSDTQFISIQFAQQCARRLIKGKIESMVAKGAVRAFAVNGLGTGVTFGLQILLARLMGVEQFGIYTYAITWLGLFGLFAKAGFDTAVIRYLAAYKAKQEWSLANGVVRRSFMIVTSSAALIGIAAAAVIWYLGERLNSQLALTLLLCCLALPFTAQSMLRQASLRALRNVVRARVPDEVFRPVLLCILVCLLYLLSDIALTAPVVMLLQLVSVLAAVTLGTYWLHKYLPSTVSEASPEYRTSEWVRYALPLFVFSGMHMILNRIDTIMIGFFIDTTAAGIYTVASRVAKLMIFGLSAVNFIAAPMIASLYAEGRMEELQRLLKFSSRALTLFCLPICAIIVLFGEQLLGLFGDPFKAGYLTLVILAAGQGINALAGSVGYVMTMTGQQNAALRIVAASAFVNVMLNLLLIPAMGINGAALATSLTLAGWNITFVIYVQKKLGLRTTIL